MCIYQSWSVPCSEPAPGRANRGIPGERGGQYYRGKWPVLDTLEEPTDGPRKGRGDDREGSTPPPSSYFPSTFHRNPITEFPSQNALWLGKERSRRMRPPSLLLGPSNTPSPDVGMEKVWNRGVAEVIDEAMLLDFLLPGLALASIKTAHGKQT